MTSQHITSSQHTPTPQLDAHLDGIRKEFERVNRELHEARNERDQYETNYNNQAKELRELRQIFFRHRSSNDHIICQQCKGDISHFSQAIDDNSSPIISPASSGQLDEQSNQDDDEGDVREGETLNRNDKMEDPTGISGIASLKSDETCTNDSGWDIEFPSGTEPALKLNLVHSLTQGSGTYVAFSKDGKYLATVSGIGKVCLFDVKTRERISVMRLRDLYAKPETDVTYCCLAFSPDSQYLATGAGDGKIRIWIISHRRVKSIFSHEATIYDLHFSPNGQSIVASSYDSLRIWRLRDGFSRILHPYSSYAGRFSTDGRYVISGAYSGRMLIWSARRRNLVARIRGRHARDMNCLRFTPDGKGLLSASDDGTVIYWDVTSLGSLGMEGLEDDDPTTISSVMEISRLAGHTRSISTVSISPDGKWIVSGSWDKTVRIWNAHDATLQCILDHRASIYSVDFCPVGNYLAIGDGQGKVTIWNYAEM